VKQQAGIRGFKYIPLIYCLFITILLSNLFSLMPYSFALTSQIINIFFLSFSLIMGLFITGLINFGFNFFKIFIPESPILLLLLLIPIEIFSYFIRAFSIAIRLSANIMAGHTLVVIVSGFLLKLSFIFLSVLSILLFVIFTLELGVAILQAYVFTVLFTIYLKDSL
jgi:ATP synthase subunit 6